MVGLPPGFGRLAIDPESGFRGCILFAAAVVVACYVWLSRTRSGRHLYALGSSLSAARIVGISHARGWLLAFGVGGLLTGLAGVLQLALSEQMQAGLGRGWELAAIAAAVIGGVAIAGGRGTVLGVLLGAILLRLTNSALVHWGISDEQVDLLVGGMILAAVLLDLAWRRRTA
jgi:rhamnose transport system permease protein